MRIYRYEKTRLLTYRQFMGRQLLFWLYAMIWGLCGWGLYAADLGSIAKGVGAVLLILGTPAIEDLLLSYERYRRTWLAGNPRTASGWSVDSTS